MDIVAFVEVFLGRPALAFSMAAIFIGLASFLLCKENSLGSVFVSITGVMWILYGLWEAFLVANFNVPVGRYYFRCDMFATVPIMGILTLGSVLLVIANCVGDIRVKARGHSCFTVARPQEGMCIITDIAPEPQLGRHLADIFVICMDRPSHTILDFTEVGVITQRSLRRLLKLRKMLNSKCPQYGLILYGVRMSAESTIKDPGFGGVFEIVKNQSEALRKLKAVSEGET